MSKVTFRVKKRASTIRKPNTIIIWMPNCIADDKTLESGTVRRGKYTLPNTFALCVNVPAFLLTVVAKKDQMALLLK